MAASNLNTENNQSLICILTAGRGTRMGKDLSINKALLPLNGKAILSSIIEKFPINSRYIIGLGHNSKQVRDFLAAAHPDRNLEFVSIKKTEGIGSGPGQSLLECAPYLQSPFYFAACDIFWEGNLPLNKKNSWIAVAPVPKNEQESYCNAILYKNTVIDFLDKKIPESSISKAFTGLAYIHEPAIFFTGLINAEFIKSELQVSSGLSALIKNNLEAIEIPWKDLGTWEKYRSAAALFESFDFSKNNEFLYFYDDKVIKFFSDSQIISKRVKKANLNPQVFPQIIFEGEQLYSYKFCEGKTLYEDFSLQHLEKLLSWLEKKLWVNKESQDYEMPALCKEFYQDKTNLRINQWRNRYPDFIEHKIINEKNTPSLYVLMEKMPWNLLMKGISSFIHGDLQPDNILCTSHGFLLLDWRQDFAGSIQIGDLYYDLAKLRGGLLLNYRLVKEGKFSYEEHENNCKFSLPQFPLQKEALALLDQYIISNNYDLNKVKLLNGLIFANMAPLHAAPFDKFLWALARETLTKELPL